MLLPFLKESDFEGLVREKAMIGIGYMMERNLKEPTIGIFKMLTSSFFLVMILLESQQELESLVLF